MYTNVRIMMKVLMYTPACVYESVNVHNTQDKASNGVLGGFNGAENYPLDYGYI